MIGMTITPKMPQRLMTKIDATEAAHKRGRGAAAKAERGGLATEEEAAEGRAEEEALHAAQRFMRWFVRLLAAVRQGCRLNGVGPGLSFMLAMAAPVL